MFYEFSLREEKFEIWCICDCCGLSNTVEETTWCSQEGQTLSDPHSMRNIPAQAFFPSLVMSVLGNAVCSGTHGLCWGCSWHKAQLDQELETPNHVNFVQKQRSENGCQHLPVYNQHDCKPAPWPCSVPQLTPPRNSHGSGIFGVPLSEEQREIPEQPRSSPAQLRLLCHGPLGQHMRNSTGEVCETAALQT